MIDSILIHVSVFATHMISTLGYFGVAILMGIGSAAIPLPSEVIMPFAGFLIAAGRFNLFGLALTGAIGSTLGSLITYYIGYYGGRPLVAKYGHIIFISENDLNLTDKFFHKFKHTSILLGQMLPVVRAFISIPAGISKVPIRNFLISTFAGAFIWSLFLAWLGLRLGENWNHLSGYFHKFDAVILVALVCGFIYWVYRHFKGRVRS